MLTLVGTGVVPFCRLASMTLAVPAAFTLKVWKLVPATARSPVKISVMATPVGVPDVGRDA
jgi:hypothetical protein